MWQAAGTGKKAAQVYFPEVKAPWTLNGGDLLITDLDVVVADKIQRTRA